MTEQLPAQWALDMAAKEAGWRDWAQIENAGVLPSSFAKSIIAHARTLERLAKYRPELVPVDPDWADLVAIFRAWGSSCAKRIEDGNVDDEDRAALAELKRIKANG